MLDHAQARALETARHRPIRVSGFPGSGRSHLARAIAEDAARRGRSCLLVGPSPILDVPIGPPPRPARLHPVLARRASGPVATHGAESPPPRGDLALRAILDPEGAALARRLLGRAGEILASHALDPIEVEAAAEPGRDPALDAGLALALSDAGTAAAGIWRDGLEGRTLGDLLAAAAGDEVGADVPTAGVVLDRDPAAVAASLRAMAAPEGADGRGWAALREALDPWAFRPELRDVGEAHAWADRQASLFEDVAGLLSRSGSYAAAESAGDASAMALRTLGVLRSRFPDRDEAEAIDACERIGRAHRAQARGLEPFLPAQAGRSVQSLRDLPAVPSHRVRTPRDPQPVREANLALGRFLRAADDLSFRIGPEAWSAVLAADPRSLRDGVPHAPQGERARAAVEMRRIRNAFAELGYGDVLTFPGFPDEVGGADVIAAPGPGASASFLDLLLPVRTSVPVQADAGGATIRRIRSREDIPGIGDDYDVVVIDDEAGTDDAVMAAVDGIGTLTHAIGVEPGDSDGIVLSHPHRQRDAALANVAAGTDRSPYWLGCPRGAGIVARVLGDADRGALAAGAGRVAGALADAGYDAAVLDGGEPGAVRADIVVVHAEEVDDGLLRRAAGSARDGLVLVCRSLSADLPDIGAVEGHAGLSAHGWSLVVDVVEGRIFTRGGKSAILVREPAWNDLAGETIVERIDRIAALGWSPVVDWIGALRDPGELSDLLARSAVGPDPRMRRIMEGHPLEG